MRKWVRRILNLHSPSQHAMGTCWCVGTKREIFPEQITARHALADIEEFYRFVSRVACNDPSCKYLEPHMHGFACDVTCWTCRSLTKKRTDVRTE